MSPYLAAHQAESFDVVLSGVGVAPCYCHSSEDLEEFARILKPSGKLTIAEPVTNESEIISSGVYILPYLLHTCS